MYYAHLYLGKYLLHYRFSVTSSTHTCQHSEAYEQLLARISINGLEGNISTLGYWPISASQQWKKKHNEKLTKSLLV